MDGELTREDWGRYRASLPHEPLWNLIPRRRGAGPWECSWHGAVSGEDCGECQREHAEYLEGGTWEDRRPVPSPEEAAAARELTALTEELGLYDAGPDCG